MAKYKIIPSSRTIVQSPISIGHKAEKGVEAIEFDLTAWVETYGSGTLTVIMRRWGDAIPYPIALEIDDNNKATWTLSDIDTAKAGMAYAQLSYIVGDEVVKKSDIYTFRVMDSLTGEGEPPEAYESWLEHLTHLAAEAMAEVLDIEGIVTDKTLTVDGGIADAKATGDALALKADKSTTYTKAEVDQMIEDVEIETDTTLSVSGAPADAKKTGDALGALEDQFNEETDKLKADLGDNAIDIKGVTGCKPLVFITGKYIALDGATADVTALVANAKFRTCVVPVSEGDVFTVNVTGSTVARAWGFVDGDGNVLSVANTNMPFIDRILIAPTGSTYLVLNDMNTSGACFSGYALVGRVDDTELYKGIINVSRRIPLESGFYTLETAIAAVYDNIPSARTGGVIITFVGEKPGTTGSSYVWTYQLQRNDNVVNESNFKKTSNWVLLNRETKTSWVFAAYDSSDEAKMYADIVQTSSDDNIINKISNQIAKMSNGGRIYLKNGTYYSANSGINVLYDNIAIEGESLGVTIQRGSGNAIFTQSKKIGVQLANLRVLSPVNFVNDTEVIYSDCYINGEYKDTHLMPFGNIIEVGADRQYKTLSEAYNIFRGSAKRYQQHDRWEIHVYGHIVETAAFNVSYNYIDIIGHNALIEFRGNKDVRLTVARDSANYDAGNDVTKFKTLRDIHFLKTGCYNYWNSSVVHVTAPDVKFYNCTFENRSSSPSPFNQENEGSETYTGSRRHGCTININLYGNNCITEFHNCIGIGSPYGFQNTRGFYIMYGSPKLYDCIGYGGGIGVYGHGIINHRSSKAELYNCVGVGSKWGYREATGLRFQAGGSAVLVGCIGFGGNGEKHISNGVSATRITEICEELEIDPSTYVSGDTVNYSLLTDEICALIRNEDVDIVATGELPENNHGISFWSSNGKAKLDSCIGYCGNGPESYGLHANARSTPVIIGGYYGIQDKMLTRETSATSETDYSFALDDIPFSDLNQYTDIEVSRVCVSMAGGAYPNHDLLYIETDEATPQVIVNGFDLYGIPSIAMPTCSTAKINANTPLVAYVKHNGTKITFPYSRISAIHVFYNYLGGAVYIGDEADPVIHGARFTSAEDSSVDIMTVEYSQGGAVSEARIFDCAFSKAPSNGIMFAAKTAVNGSSNYIS